MTNQTNKPIPCPKCSQPLRRIKLLATATYECRHCHSFWLDRNQSNPLRSKDGSQGAEHLMAELTSKNNPDRSLRQAPVAWVISVFLQFVLPLPVILIGLVFMILSFTDDSKFQFSPFTLVMAIPLVVLGVHSYHAGKALRQISLTSVPRLNRFLIAATIYGLASSIGLVCGFDANHDWVTKMGMVCFAWLLFFLLPLLPVSLYIHFSKRVKELYLTWDAADSAQSQTGG